MSIKQPLQAKTMRYSLRLVNRNGIVSREVHENRTGLICLEWQKPLAGTLPSRLTEHGEETELAERDLAEQQEKVPKVFEQVLQAETKELNMSTEEDNDTRKARIRRTLIDCGVGPTQALENEEYSDLEEYIFDLDANCDRLLDCLKEIRSVVQRYEDGEIEEVAVAYERIVSALD